MKRGDETTQRVARGLAVGVLVAVNLSGCGGRSKPDSPMLPDSPTARTAVAAAMASWQALRPVGILETRAPRIQVVDSFRVPEQALKRYEIVGETVSGTMREITIRAFLANPEAEQVIRYRVIGVDPVLVMREEDYRLMVHWEHKMAEEAPAPESPIVPVPK